MDKLPESARSMSDLPTLKELTEYGIHRGLITPGQGVDDLIARIRLAVAASDRATDFKGRTTDQWYHDTYRIGLGEGTYDYVSNRWGPQVWKDQLTAIRGVVDYRRDRKGKNPRFTGEIMNKTYLNPRDFLDAAKDELHGLIRYDSRVLAYPSPGQSTQKLDLSYLTELLEASGKKLVIEDGLMSAVDDVEFTGRGPFQPTKGKVYFNDEGRVVKVVHTDTVIEGGDFIDLYLYDRAGKCISYETRKGDAKYRLITEEGYFWPNDQGEYIKSDSNKEQVGMPFRQGMLTGLGED